VALISSLIGGVAVAVVTQLSTRKRTQAEVRKIDAEAERTRAETAKVLNELKVPPTPRPGRRRPPPGWFLAGSQPSDYDVGTDATVAHSGSRSGFIQARPDARGFGTLMQSFKAERFRGTRLRLSAFPRLSGRPTSMIGAASGCV
jgi:hypothetical protein